MAFIGNTNTTQAFTPAIDTFSGNGSTVAFTLSRPVASVAQVQVVIANVPQDPNSAYTVSSNTITFTSAPLSGTNNIYVYYTSPITQVITPGQSTVGTTQIQNGVTINFADGSASAPSITNDGDTNTGIFFPAADTIAFSEGGAEAMRIDSSGNVIIGASSALGAERLLIAKGSTVTTDPFSGGAQTVDLQNTSNTVGNSTSINNFDSGGRGNSYIRFINIDQNYAGAITFGTATTGAANFGERMRIDSSGNVGIGTTSNLGSSKLDVRGRIRVGTGNSTGDSELVYSNYASATTAWATSVRQDVGGANNDLKFLRFDSSGTYQGIAMQIDSASGNLLVGTTSAFVTPARIAIVYSGDTTWGIGFKSTFNSGAGQPCTFINTSNTVVGYIGTSSTATSYNTSSDYRLKEDIAPMTGALAKVALLKPVNYKWKSDGSDGQGFIAHELAEVVPQCVSGEKNAVDADGNPSYQGVDTSFLVATLTAAIQEQQALIQSLTARITALENR